MPGELIYQLPPFSESLAEIVQAVPATWSCVDGLLLAPPSFYENGQVARQTMLIVSPLGLSHIVDDFWEYDPSTFPLEEVSPGKLFSSFYFSEAGLGNQGFPFEQVRELIARMLRKGYRGEATFFSGYRNNSPFKNPERFRFTHSPERVGNSQGLFPPHLRLCWDDGYNGRRENLSSLLEIIQRMNLEVLQARQEWGGPFIVEALENGEELWEV